MTRPTDAEVDAELAALEARDIALEDEDCYEDGLTGAIKALRERLTPGQVTTIARREGLKDAELEAATVAANWRMGLSPDRPSALFIR